MLLMGVCIALAMQNLTSMPRVEDHNQDSSGWGVEVQLNMAHDRHVSHLVCIRCAALPVFACCSLYVILVLV